MNRLYRLFLIASLLPAARGAAAVNTVRLALPPAVYAVPGQECNIYFDNIILTTNWSNYAFDVDCARGRQDRARWRFTPLPADVGRHPWKIKIYDAANCLVGEGGTEIIVSPADAGADQPVSLMIVGDSLTDASGYPRELYRLFQNPGNAKVTFIGSHSGSGKPIGGFAHEGYGGWTWKAFLTQWSTEEPQHYRSKSKFLVEKDGKPVFDFKAYCEKNAGGKPPDFITIMLGINDVGNAPEENRETVIDGILKNADTLIAGFLKDAPNAVIGVGLVVPPAASQDAFGANYKCSLARWPYRCNQHRLVERMIVHFAGAKQKNVSLVPLHVNLDCENGYPTAEEPINAREPGMVLHQVNGVHPGRSGYLQIADSFYGWLKFQLARRFPGGKK